MFQGIFYRVPPFFGHTNHESAESFSKVMDVQRILALILIGLGGGCLLFPDSVESPLMRPAFNVGNRTTRLSVECFGAQAILAGIVIYTSRFLPSSFLIFGIVASVRFFGFNYYFLYVACFPIGCCSTSRGISPFLLAVWGAIT